MQLGAIRSREVRLPPSHSAELPELRSVCWDQADEVAREPTVRDRKNRQTRPDYEDICVEILGVCTVSLFGAWLYYGVFRYSRRLCDRMRRYRGSS